jgi:hypothetical protein
MHAHLELLLRRYKSRGILLDTNLLLLFAIGNYSPQRILTFKRTTQYTLRDFEMILSIIGYFDRRVTTPNILTEVDNLSRQLPEREHVAVAGVMSQLIAQLFEVYTPSAHIVPQEAYADFGLTDCITMAYAREVLIVTDDFPLSGMLASQGRDVLNLNHFRDMDLDWNWTA